MDAVSMTSHVATICPASLAGELNAWGCARIEKLLRPEDCDAMAELYGTSTPFRSHIHMARHGFGRGEYKYFAHPLPDMVQTLRQNLYPLLAPIANDWNERLGIDARFPPQYAEYLERCNAAGQMRPTPLLLQYEEGDYDCQHQDVYGELLFPLQVAVLLSTPETDFSGGEFVLTEQHPACKAVPRWCLCKRVMRRSSLCATAR